MASATEAFPLLFSSPNTCRAGFSDHQHLSSTGFIYLRCKNVRAIA